MENSMKRILFIAITAILVLTACAPAQVTSSPDDAAGFIATSVALTVSSHEMQTAEAVPPATDTPLPTATEAVTATIEFISDFETDTPEPTITSEPTNTVTPPVSYSCDAYGVTPKDHATLDAGSRFDIQWVIVNTGTKSWSAGTDVAYASGTKMTTTTRVEIPVALGPNERYTVNLDAVAPDQAGTYYMSWVVKGQNCSPSIIINVE
jgi:hypothetical protein